MDKNKNATQRFIERIDEKTVFILFILVQPFLDYYFMFEENIKQYTIISVSTIIRLIFIGISFLWVLHSFRGRKILWHLWTIYFLVVSIYSIVHIYLCISFPITLPDGFQFIISDEIFYLVRVILPLMLLFVTYYQDLSIDQVRRVSIALVYIIGSTMILSNLLKFSLIAYSDMPKFSQYTFLTWFSRQSINFRDLTSKGLFYKGNQISGVLVLLMPINLMFFLKKSTTVSFFSNLLLIICMYMLGSKVGVYGMLISFISILFIWISEKIRRKEKLLPLTLLQYLVLIIVFASIYPFSPYQVRAISDELAYVQHANETLNNSNSNNNPTNTNPSNGNNSTKPLTDIEKNLIKVTILENRLNKVYMPSDFFKIYPVKYDYDFWISLEKLPYSNYNDSRKLQQLITSRIYSRLDTMQWKYELFGMGRSRFTTGNLLIEKDFVLQKYMIGDIGIVLFFLPYVIICFLIALRMIRKPYTQFTFENLSVFFSICLFFATSLFSGHLIDELFPIILCVFYMGFLFKVTLISTRISNQLIIWRAEE